MKKYIIDESTLTGLANAIRKVNGSIRTYTPEQMIEAVTTILDSATYILVDENGNEVPAVFVENKTIFDATANDIRIGKVAANQNGVVEGTKEIPTYQAEEGYVVIKSGDAMTISMYSDICQYTTLQVIVCSYNTSFEDSVSAEKVVIKNNVYNVGSTVSLSTVSVDPASQSIELGLTNTGDSSVILRFMIIKEDA